MTTHDKDKIISAAKEAGIKLTPFVVDGEEYDFCEVEMDADENLERFYAIAFEDGRKAEREECAKVAISYDSSPWAHDQSSLHVADIVAAAISKQIRARSTK